MLVPKETNCHDKKSLQICTIQILQFRLKRINKI